MSFYTMFWERGEWEGRGKKEQLHIPSSLVSNTVLYSKLLQIVVLRFASQTLLSPQYHWIRQGTDNTRPTYVSRIQMSSEMREWNSKIQVPGNSKTSPEKATLGQVYHTPLTRTRFPYSFLLMPLSWSFHPHDATCHLLSWPGLGQSSMIFLHNITLYLLWTFSVDDGLLPLGPLLSFGFFSPWFSGSLSLSSCLCICVCVSVSLPLCVSFSRSLFFFWRSLSVCLNLQQIGFSLLTQLKMK